MKTVGFNEHRLKKDDPYHKNELIALESFDKFTNNRSYDQMEGLIGIKNAPEGERVLTERDMKVAMSVIQWLGTPVGEGFLRTFEKDKLAHSLGYKKLEE